MSIVYLYAFYSQNLPISDYENYGMVYFTIIAGICLLLIYIRASTSPKGANSNKVYWGFTMAVFFYFLGELTYSIQIVLYSETTYPSISDLFWAIGTILFIDELFSLISVINVKFSKKHLFYIFSITGLSVLVIIVLAFADVIKASYSTDPEALYTPFMKAMDLFYFTGDTLILFATVYVVFGLFSITGFKLSTKHLSWIFLILGNVSMIIGDTLFSYFEWKGADFSVSLFNFFTLTLQAGDYRVDDMLYMLQYLFWALSFVFFPPYLNRSFKPIESEEEITSSTEQSTDPDQEDQKSENVEQNNSDNQITSQNNENTLGST